jgi:hypothetical protein
VHVNQLELWTVRRARIGTSTTTNRARVREQVDDHQPQLWHAAWTKTAQVPLELSHPLSALSRLLELVRGPDTELIDAQAGP